MELLLKIQSRLIEQPNGCQEWSGKRNGKGYGLMKVGGRWVKVHRLVALATYGEGGPLALHHCDNPPCCKAEHLYLGTVSDNMQDAVKRGHFVRPTPPEKPNAHVKREDVPVIRERWRAGETQAAIGLDYGICGAAVHMIVRGKSWGDVPGALEADEAKVIALSRDGGARSRRRA